MDMTYQQLVEGHDVFRFRGWIEGDEVVAHHRIKGVGEWHLAKGVLVIEDASNDIVCLFEHRGAYISIRTYERIVRESNDRRRMHDDRCPLLHHVKVRKRDLRVTAVDDAFQADAEARLATLENISAYAHLLEDGELEEMRKSVERTDISSYTKKRDRDVRRCIRMIDAMMRMLDDPDASETRELVHKALPFSPTPLRPNCRLTSVRKSYMRRVHRKGSA